jgi:hypothetical protein
MVSLGVMYAWSWCVALLRLEMLLPLHVWVVVVSYLEALVVERFSWLIYVCHVSWMVCVVAVIGLESFVCSWNAGSVSVVARVIKAMSSLGGGRGLSPLCSFACIAYAFSIRSCVCPDDVVRDSSILVQSLTPSSHRGPSVLRVCLRIEEVGIWF